jgi:hypothetical protein
MCEKWSFLSEFMELDIIFYIVPGYSEKQFSAWRSISGDFKFHECRGNGTPETAKVKFRERNMEN